MTNAVIGLVIAVLAYTVVAVVSNTISSLNPAGTGNGGGTGENPNTQANQNLQRSFYPRTSDAFTRFDVSINASLADLKVLCPTTDQEPTVRAAGDVKVIIPPGPRDPNDPNAQSDDVRNNMDNWHRESFGLPNTPLNVAGDSVSGVISAVEHSNAPISTDQDYSQGGNTYQEQVVVGVTYFVNNCNVRTEKTFTASEILGR